MRYPSRIIGIFLLITGFLNSGYAQSSPYSLKQCIDTAINNSLVIQQNLNTVELSKLGIKQSKNNLLPGINGNISETLSAGKMLNSVSGTYETGTGWSTGAGLTVTQNLFSGLQFLNAIKQSELIYSSSKYDLEDAKFNLTISVVNAFLQILYTGEAIKIAQQQVGFDSVQMQNIADMVYVGKKTESDLLQVKAQLHADQYLVVNAESQWRLAKVNLQQLMNLSVNESFDIDYNTSMEPLLKGMEDVGSIYIQSLAYQPIIKSYSLKSQSAVYGLKIARGGYYPQLLFKGTVGTDYSSQAKQTNTSTISMLENIGYLQSNPSQLVLGNVPQLNTTVKNYPFGNQLGDNVNGNFSIALSVPILNYLQVRNNVKKQEVNINNALLNEQYTKLTLRKTIEQVYVNVQNANAQYNSAKEEVEASKAAYDISVVKFKEGKEIITNLLVQKNAYVKALSDNLQSKYGLLFNIKILDYYKGIPITY